MALGVIEIFVLVFVILGLIKLLVVLFSPKSWVGVAKGVYKNPALLVIVELILAAILFYYLLPAIGLVYLMAGVVLGTLLTGLTFAVFAKEVTPLVNKILKPNMLKKMWLPLIIWVILMVWTLIELL